MKVTRLDYKHFDSSELDKIAQVFIRGGVVAFPTDTVYGLGCAATCKAAVERVFEIKKRPEGFGLPILVKSYCMLHDYFIVNRGQEEYLRRVWVSRTPRGYENRLDEMSKPSDRVAKSAKNNSPTSFVLMPKKGKLVDRALAADGSAAVRMPKNKFLLKLISKVNAPIAATSLNISGEDTLRDISDINNSFEDELPDLAVNSGVIKNKPSSIIDIRNLDKIIKIR